MASSKEPVYQYEFDGSAANRVCRFVEQLPHTKGKWAAKSERIRLEPWQCFVFCSIFGWKHRDSGLRRFRLAYLCVPRKNGKSAIAAGIGLYMLCADGEFGAEVYSGATTEKQAWEVFKPAKIMVERTKRLQEQFGIVPAASSIFIPQNGSKFEPIIGSPGDGASPSCFIVDEYHEHKTDELFDTMQTGTGAREQPLGLIITTAGSNIGGPCYLFQREVEKVLDGSLVRDELWGCIYGIDDGDDWASDAALRKANPNYGVSKFADSLQIEVKNAVSDARKQNVCKTKHLNVWVNAAAGWINMERWRACADPSLKREEFVGLPAVIAVDVASKIDIAARALIFSKKIGSKDHYYLFIDSYLPAEQANKPENQHYQSWVKKGLLKTTPGRVIDYNRIEADTVAEITRFRVKEIAFDPWNAEKLAQDIAAKTRATAVEVPQQPRYLSQPMKEFDSLVEDGRLHHDGNELSNWMFSNVIAKPHANENFTPDKERAENKIDGPVAAIMAMSRALVGKASESVYANRGVRTF